MFYSFQGFEKKTEDNWRESRHEETINHMNRQFGFDSNMSQFEHLTNIVQNTINAACGEGSNNQNFSNLIGFDGPFDYQTAHPSFVWREAEAQNVTASPSGPLELPAARWNLNRQTCNSGLTDFSSFAWNNHGLVSQPYDRSTFFPSFDSFQSFTQMPSVESRFEEFRMNQIEFNEKLLKEMKSLSSSLNTLITHHQRMLETENSSFRPHNEQNNDMALRSDCEIENSSSKKTQIWLDTNEIESKQVENREVQEEPKYIPPPPYIPPIPFPQRLIRAEIVISNELELKHPPIEHMNEELEEKKDGDTNLKVEASDNTNEKFNQIDLSTLRRCLEKLDVMEDNKSQINYHIIIEPRKMTFKEEHSKHVSKEPLKHFWENYDALRGRKVKIR